MDETPIYRIDEKGIYCPEPDGKVRLARPDPLTPGRPLIPAGYVRVAPLATSHNEACLYVNGEPRVVPDFRGEYWMPDRTKVIISDVDVRPPVGYLLEDPGPTIQQASDKCLALLESAYRLAVQADVTYTSVAGVTKTFQADTGSVTDLTSMLLAFGGTTIVPDGFYWKSSDNTHVPFVFADLQGLARVIGAVGFAQFVVLQGLKDKVAQAVSAHDMQSLLDVTWPTDTDDADGVVDV